MDAHEVAFLDELSAFLNAPDVVELFTTHPNKTALPDFERPEAWRPWWEWASEVDIDAVDASEAKWILLWHYYTAPSEKTRAYDSIPEELRSFIDRCSTLQLNREPGTIAYPQSSPARDDCPRGIPLPPAGGREEEARLRGMSPKKAHEVSRMTEYTSRLLAYVSQQDAVTSHVVDIGAGQAYISRALRDELGLDILALDWSDIQTEGATRRDAKLSAANNIKGTLVYRTLPIDKSSLLTVTNEWISQAFASGVTEQRLRDEPVPVLLLALHACGSLTLDILRAFTHQVKTTTPSWRPTAALIVGCCYNMLTPEDSAPLTRRNVALSANHLQLAAQVPRHWGRTAKAFVEAKLAVRKVAWRAMLERVVLGRSDAMNDHRSTRPEGGSKAQRLGRLSDAAYKDWETFLSAAEKRLGVELAGIKRDVCAESRLGVFHFLRCVAGPVVESFLLLDRRAWLCEELQNTGYVARLVNLFDQRADSARNVAVVVAREGDRGCRRGQ